MGLLGTLKRRGKGAGEAGGAGEVMTIDY